MKKSFLESDCPQNVLEDVYKSLGCGKISKQEAVNLIIKDVQQHPLSYHIPPNAEDIRSELSIRLMHTVFFIFDKYRPEYCPFSAYVRSFVRFQYMNLVREQIKKQQTESQIQKEAEFVYEHESSKYQEEEFAGKIEKLKSKNTGLTQKAPYRASHIPTEKQLESLIAKPKKAFKDFWKASDSKSERSALVVALKSSWYLNENHIQNVSKYCGIEQDVLQNAVDVLRSDLGKKQDRLCSLQKTRDKAYQLHVQFRSEMQKAKPESTERYNRLKTKYDLHTKRWQNMNRTLQKSGYKVCPSNKTLAELLGICERQVGYYIQIAEDVLKDIGDA